MEREVTSGCRGQSEEDVVSSAGERHREESAAVLKDDVTNQVTRKKMEGGQGSDGVRRLPPRGARRGGLTWRLLLAGPCLLALS